tara:strand:+ start:5571 stop:5834 length:264 start_codon:yes stop_codon:yes gene_type:complete
MPSGKHKSRTLRRVFVRTISGNVTKHFRKRKSAKRSCGGCGSTLKGVPHNIQSKFKNLSKTKKRPERPYGGVLCSSCMRKKMIQQVE